MMEESAAPRRSGPEPAQRLPTVDRFAADLRRFGPVGILAILLVLAGNLIAVPLSAILVMVWAWRSDTPWREIGYGRPRSWIGSLIVGLMFGASFKLLMKAVVMPLLGADPINQAYHYLARNPAMVPAMLFMIIAGAGFGEETVFRGFLFERLGKLIGASFRAKTLSVLITAGVFGLAHYSVQGLAGVQQAVIVGLVFGTIFAATGRIWMLMVAHAAFDLTAYALIYWELEAYAARLVFK